MSQQLLEMFVSHHFSVGGSALRKKQQLAVGVSNDVHMVSVYPYIFFVSDVKSYNRIRYFLHYTCPLHTSSGECGNREAQNIWPMVKPEKAAPVVTRTTLRTTGPVPANFRW